MTVTSAYPRDGEFLVLEEINVASLPAGLPERTRALLARQR